VIRERQVHEQRRQGDVHRRRSDQVVLRDELDTRCGKGRRDRADVSLLLEHHALSAADPAAVDQLQTQHVKFEQHFGLVNADLSTRLPLVVSVR